jgi:hypothetical protein
MDAAAGAAEPAAGPSSAIQLASSGAAGAASGPTAGATGLALSPGGLFAAVVRTAFGVPAARCAEPSDPKPCFVFNVECPVPSSIMTRNVLLGAEAASVGLGIMLGVDGACQSS